MTKILIVDDEPNIFWFTTIMLENEGYQVIEAKSGEECLKKLKNEKPDLILLDVMMPGEDGYEICKKIKANKKTKDIPVVMFTVKTSPDSVEKGKESGATGQINKPFSREDLLDTVDKALEERAA